MNSENGGLSSAERQRQTAAEIVRRRVLSAYSSTINNTRRPNYIQNTRNYAQYSNTAASRSLQHTEHPAHAISSGQLTTPPHPIYSLNNTPKATTYAPATPEVHELPTSIASPQPAKPDRSVYPLPEPTAFKDTPINTAAVDEEWKKYHSAWQDYYQNYYSDYYAKAAQTYLATQKLKAERLATGKAEHERRTRRFLPAAILVLVILTALFLQYNRLIFAPIMAYLSPGSGSVATSIEAVDPTVSGSVSPEPRLIIPKLNIDAPVAFGISPNEVATAMNSGVAQFAVSGANALPGQIGNLAISGHSAGDVYSSSQYKFIFSGLSRLEVGDLIYINYESVRYTYQMVGSEVVNPTDVAALAYNGDKPMLTLITCTPLGTARYRLLIKAEQISPEYDSGNVAETDPELTGDSESLPSNSPTLFESLWQGIFGGN